MLYKQPGDDWQRFANLRLLYTYMFTFPGKKLLFMGNEIAQAGNGILMPVLSGTCWNMKVTRGYRNWLVT